MAVNPTKVLIIDDSDVPPTPDRLPAYCPRCGVRYVGKESNRLDEVEHGLVHSLDEVQATYEDPSLDLWPEVIVPILKQRTAAVWARETGCSARTVKGLRNTSRKPQPKNRHRLLRAIDRWATRQLARKWPDLKHVELAQRFHASLLPDELRRRAPPPRAGGGSGGRAPSRRRDVRAQPP